MSQRPLRAVTKKAAALLPQNAKFAFLAEASQAMSSHAPVLAVLLGKQALVVGVAWVACLPCTAKCVSIASAGVQTADNPAAAVARRAAMQLCSKCGVHLNPHSIATVEVKPLSTRGVRRAKTSAASSLQAGQLNRIPCNVVAVVRTCKVCFMMYALKQHCRCHVQNQQFPILFFHPCSSAFIQTTSRLHLR